MQKCRNCHFMRLAERKTLSHICTCQFLPLLPLIDYKIRYALLIPFPYAGEFGAALRFRASRESSAKRSDNEFGAEVYKILILCLGSLLNSLKSSWTSFIMPILSFQASFHGWSTFNQARRYKRQNS